MKYRHAPYDFELEVLPVSSGTLASIIRNQYVDIGNLFEFIAPLLYKTPHFRSGKNWFTLVNVTCTHTDFSYGICTAPAKENAPQSCTWLFTFALNAARYDAGSVVTFSSLRGINMVAWGNRDGKFLTIGVTHSQAGEYGLRYDMMTPRYVYYLLGAVTKSFAVNNRYMTTNADYSANYANLRPEIMYSSLYMKPLYNLMMRTPYHLWIYNRHVWASAPHLISVKHITAETLLYFCMYIRNTSKLLPEVEEKVLDMFHESLTDMVQRHDQDSNSQAVAEWQQLYAALANRGRIPDNGYVFGWLQEQDYITPVPTGDFNSHLRSLIYGSDAGSSTGLKV